MEIEYPQHFMRNGMLVAGPEPGVRRYHSLILFVSKAFTMSRFPLPKMFFDQIATTIQINGRGVRRNQAGVGEQKFECMHFEGVKFECKDSEAGWGGKNSVQYPLKTPFIDILFLYFFPILFFYYHSQLIPYQTECK